MVRQGNRAKVDLTKEDADQLINAALGLTLSEAENAFAKAIASDARLSRDDIALRARGEAAGDPQERAARVLPHRRAARRTWAASSS